MTFRRPFQGDPPIATPKAPAPPPVASPRPRRTLAERRWDNISEADWQGQVVKAVRQICGDRALVYHTYDSRSSDEGFPDLVIVVGTTVLFVEVKTMKGQLSPAQEAWGAALVRAKRVQWRLWRPNNMADVEETLKEALR